MAKDIKIAPDLNEVEVADDSIHTDWNGGITYKAKLADIRKDTDPSGIFTFLLSFG